MEMQILQTPAQCSPWERRSPWRPCWTHHVDSSLTLTTHGHLQMKNTNISLYSFLVQLNNCQVQLPSQAVLKRQTFFYMPSVTSECSSPFWRDTIRQRYLSWGEHPWCSPELPKSSEWGWDPSCGPVGSTSGMWSVARLILCSTRFFSENMGYPCPHVTNMASCQSHLLTEALIIEV